MKTVAFFGHRNIFNNDTIKKRVFDLLCDLKQQGYTKFLVGSHGEFDRIVLSACLEYKNIIDNNIKIYVVLTNIPFSSKQTQVGNKIESYEDNGCETLFYDIENVYYKNRIIFSNKKMVDNADLIVCYVNMNDYKSGAKTAIKYAIKQNKTIVNLFKN